MSSDMEERWKHGYFKGTTFNNGHIMVNIEKDYVVIKNAENENGYIHHGEFLFYIGSALRGKTPTGNTVNADTNGNGDISLKEAFEYPYSWDSWNPYGDHYPSNPIEAGHDTNDKGTIEYESEMEIPQISDTGDISDNSYL